MSIDAHLHIWTPTTRFYAWLDNAPAALRRDHDLVAAGPALSRAGVEGVVLVQAADSHDETFALLAAARSDRRVRGVVGWVPLERPEETAAVLEALCTVPVFVGVRTLSHDHPDPRWLLRPGVARSLRQVEACGVPLDVAAATLDQLEAIATLVERHPDLAVILDHLGRPPCGHDEVWATWARLIARIAASPRSRAKLSGLATRDLPASRHPSTWTAGVDHALAVFGPDRLMMGSDWPVSTLAGGYEEIWRAQVDQLAMLSAAERAAILTGAERSYRLRAQGADPVSARVS